MREILFRGKRWNNGEWVYGDLLHDGIDYHMAIRGMGSHSVIAVDPATVGQYTGLTDKNGKKIFEGDMCQIKNHRLISNLPFVVEWEDFVYNGWVWRDLDIVGAMDSFTNGVAKHCEVVGNIHDNPELLEDYE